MGELRQVVAVAAATPLGVPIQGAVVRVTHSKLGLLQEGRTDAQGLAAFARAYDQESEAGTFMVAEVSGPGRLRATGRLVVKTLVAGKRTAALQDLTLRRAPRRRFVG